jgi:hypothetical protein
MNVQIAPTARAIERYEPYRRNLTIIKTLFCEFIYKCSMEASANECKDERSNRPYGTGDK